MPVELVAFGIVIDDIVFPDGRTAMGRLGGGGPQAAFGMRLWSDSVGLVASIGPDLPDAAFKWLEQSGIDMTGLIENDLPTPRAWQVLEADGRRTQVWRVPGEVIGRQLGRSLERIPQDYRHARGFHYGIHPDEPGLKFAQDLAGLGGTVSIEPFKPADRLPAPETIARLAACAGIFSPNLEEAISITGVGNADQSAASLANSGIQVVPLRMGAQGSFVLDARNKRSLAIPAYPVEVVDPIGAGNAYCGGFLAGWVETEDILTAGLYGAVAASFLMETDGIPLVGGEMRKEARRRVEQIKPMVRTNL